MYVVYIAVGSSASSPAAAGFALRVVLFLLFWLSPRDVLIRGRPAAAASASLLLLLLLRPPLLRVRVRVKNELHLGELPTIFTRQQQLLLLLLLLLELTSSVPTYYIQRKLSMPVAFIMWRP